MLFAYPQTLRVLIPPTITARSRVCMDRQSLLYLGSIEKIVIPDSDSRENSVQIKVIVIQKKTSFSWNPRVPRQSLCAL